MAIAQNGWTASPDKNAIGVKPFEVAGVSFPGGVRSGPVHALLTYVAEQFHRRVEPLRPGQCWGYAYRDVRGGGSLSNHSAGCAIDINAPSHPMGKRGTFTPAQMAQIQAIVQECGGAVRWGGSFSRPDEMHFEVVGNSVLAVNAVARLRGKDAVLLASTPQGEPVTHIPVTLTPERTFRVAFMAEAGASSAVVERAWITVSSTWGDTTMTITTIDPFGKVLSHRQDVVVRNNTKVAVDVPSGAAIATVEGTAQYGTTIPVVALISKARP